jgi:uncharacterized protein (TIGR04255 family)
MLKIDLEESFQHFEHAPIVEAVIEIRTRVESPWEESALRDQLKAKLPGYPKIFSQSAFRHELKVKGDQPPEQLFHDLGWKGLRLQSADGRYIAQFNRDGFVFSRLQPYESWDQFKDEAVRLWNMHAELTKSIEVQRLGVRFINRITLPVGEVRLEDYLRVPPQPPGELDLQIMSFFHQDSLLVTGHPYAINIVKTVQPPHGSGSDGGALILDIDVFTTKPFEHRPADIEKHLAEMRWLKNKVFYSSLTKGALEGLR